jgi:nanoRNase/pAp phosphatase (c-di-AMP/oligoRNAs hydrolase)
MLKMCEICGVDGRCGQEILRQMIELLGGAKRVAIVTHRRADADALACAKVLQLVLERLGVTVAAIVCPEGSQFGDCSRELPNDVDLYVLVDVASLSQVPPLRGRYFKIDHHHVGDDIPGIVVQRPSCTEIALKLAEETGVELTPEVAKLAALGIYADTGRLKRADAETLKTLSKLLEKIGGVLGDLIREEERAEEPQRIIALLKGMKRLEAYRSSLGVICISHVGAYESDVASLLLSIGCNIALVASRKEDGVHVVMRSRGFDVATLAKSLGTGGGHKEAAVAIIRENVTKSQLPSLLRGIVKQIDPSAEPLVQ